MSAAISFRDPMAEPVAIPTAEPVLVAVPRTTPLRALQMPRMAEPLPTRIAWIAIAFAVAAIYLYALLAFVAPGHPGVDQNGYFVGGRQFAQTFSSGIKPESDYAFVGHMWVLNPETGINYPKYPLGLPILFAACIWIFGERGYDLAHFISPVASAIATLGVFAIVRRFSGGFIGVLAMLLLGCGQVMFTLSINPNSHAACTCAVIWGMFFLFRWLESGALWRGISAGLLFGFAYMIRYTEGLLLLPLGVAMLYSARWRWPSVEKLGIGIIAIVSFAIAAALVARFAGERIVAHVPWLVMIRTANPFVPPTITSTGWKWLPSVMGGWAGASLSWYAGNVFRMMLAAIVVAAFVSLFVQGRALWRLLAVGVAWLVPVAYLTLFNMIHMHSWTSYAGTNESTGFSADSFMDNWEKMIRVLHDQGLFFIAPLGMLGLLVMIRRMPLVASILALWFFPSVLLYTAYYWAPDNMGVAYSRFVLTQMPAMVISAAWLMGEISRRLGSPVGVGVGQRLALIRNANGGVFSYVKPSTMGFVAIAILGIAAIGAGVWYYDAARDAEWWATVVPGSLLAISGLAALPSLAVPKWGERFDRHFSRATTRLAVGFVVFVSCSLGLARTVVGSEWGQRIFARANVELQARQNVNLAGLGNEVRRDLHPLEKDAHGKVLPRTPDDKIVLISEGERLNHLQWIGGWELFSLDAFNSEHMQRGLWRQEPDENEPDPIDPSRIKFLREVYKGKDQRALLAAQNDLIANSIAQGKRVYTCLSDASGRQFERQIDRRRFEVKRIGSYSDMPAPRRPEDFLLPSEKPKQPVNRFGRTAFNNANFFPGMGGESVRITEVVLKAAPTTGPTAVPATAPTTRPTTRPSR